MGIDEQYLLADEGYDTDAVIAQAEKQGMEPVIPPHKNRKQLRDYDKHLYQLRHWECVFAHQALARDRYPLYQEYRLDLDRCPYSLYR